MATRVHGVVTLALVGVLVAACSPTSSPVPATGQPSAATASPSAAAPAATPPTDSLRLVIDTDMAPDDVVAIASLLRDPAVEVLAITVVGTGEANCPGGMFVARAVVTMLVKAPITVACGQSLPIGAAQPFPFEWRQGADRGNGLRLVQPGYFPDPRWAQDVLVELAAAEAAAGRRLTILTLGTLTNIASAVAIDPTFAQRVRIVAMLGAVDVPGNVMPDAGVTGEPTAEWNAHADPTAVRRVLEAGFDLTLVPLDATNDVPLTPELYRRLEADHAAGPADLVFELWSINTYMTTGEYFVWDPLAAAVVRDPTLVTTRTATLRVIEGAGLDGGRLVEDPSGASVTIATSADQGRFEAFLLSSLRIGGPRENAYAPVGVVRVTAGPGTCDVTFEPPVPPPGLLQVQFAWSGEGPAGATLFDPAGIPWAELEAFVVTPDFENPPEVNDIANASLETTGSATAWGTAAVGPIGVACFSGSFEAPTVQLRGPFEVR